MADAFPLPPATGAQLQDSSLGRRRMKQLNPIIEEDGDEARARGGQRADTSHLKIEAWLSPLSDHFPTPRGVHYLAAPILPSSPSTVSGDTSPATSSNPWNRGSMGTENTAFEDLYDVSDEDDDLTKGTRRTSSVKRTRSTRGSNKALTRITIPASRDNASKNWADVDDLKMIASPVPLTPSSKLNIDPAQMQYMDQKQAEEIPTISAPPSLDGSLSSEQLALMSAPPTPVIGNDETTGESWSGVHLQPGALATLHALSNDEEYLQERPSQVLDVSRVSMEPVPEMQQQPLRLITSIQPTTTQGSTFLRPQRQTLADLTMLEIPSPGGFFEGLSPRTRTTWDMSMKLSNEVAPPTSTTAEQFYRCPWNTEDPAPPVPKRPESAEGFYRSADGSESSPPVEHIVEVGQDLLSDDMPTARPILPHQNTDSSSETLKAPESPDIEDIPTEIVLDYDPNYARQQQVEALSNLDRTGMWLMAQRIYLKGVDEELPEDHSALNTIAENLEEEDAVPATSVKSTELTVAPKKTVRFSDVIATTAVAPMRLPSKLLRKESTYYRAFQTYIVRTQQRDVFVHQLARFEALQAQRVSLREVHRNQLLGKYQLSVVPQSAKKRLSTNVARGDDNLVDDPEKMRKEKDFEAMQQVTVSTWHVAAMKMLNGGRLISAPVGKRLARLSRMASTKDGVVHDRARILDLGGQATCDWAWHCALQYPNTKIYTVTMKAIRQLSNSNIRGPPNHRQVAVERLTRLPFSDNQFDLVSARELHSMLKFVGENGEDEWETCLKECMRVLKPGGFLEFSLLDSDIMNAGPTGLAKSVEFGFSLKTLGYDPTPSKMFLGRLGRAGFQDVRRTWMCLPMGARSSIHKPPTPPLKDSPLGQPGKTCQLEAMVMGSTDNIASVCSLIGGWSWERWLLRCEMEKVSGELRLVDMVTAGTTDEAGKCLDSVPAIIEEGRNCKSGFRMLKGYAMKPQTSSSRARIPPHG